MPADIPFIRKRRQFLFVTFCTFLTFYILFVFRSYDDNRLVSWDWAFADVDLFLFVPVMISGVIITYLLFRFSLPALRPALFLFLFSFSAGFILWKAPEAIVDTSRYFTQAKHLEIYGVRYFFTEWGGAINAWTDLPLVPFLYGMIFRVFGESRIYIQAFISFLFSLTIVITYLTGKVLWDEETGIYAASMILGIPYILSQTPLMLVDVPTMFFLTLSIYTFVMAMEKGGKWIGSASLAVFCAVFSKYSAWMMLSVLVVVFLVYFIGQGSGFRVQGIGTRKQIIYRGLSICLLSGLLTGFVFFLKFDVIYGQIQFLREYQMPGLQRWGESFASTFFYQVHPFITVAALYSLYAAFRKRDLKFLIISWLMFLIVLFQIRRSRYVMITFPMLTLMASYGLQKIKYPELRKYIVSCTVASSLAVAMFAYLPFLQSMSTVNFRSAGEALNSTDIENVIIFTIPSSESVMNQAVAVPIIDLYTEKKISYFYDASSLLPYEEIEKSPLRFSWEYKNPEYYHVKDEAVTADSAIVVISNSPLDEVPAHIEKKTEGYKKVKTFYTSTGIFKYSPAVTVYIPDGT